MLLGRNESPFPENEHCKRCASKNCRELVLNGYSFRQYSGAVDCILKGQETELTGKTDCNGLVSWSGLPLRDYIVLIRMGDQHIEKVAFWKNSPKKIQVIKIRQDIK